MALTADFRSPSGSSSVARVARFYSSDLILGDDCRSIAEILLLILTASLCVQLRAISSSNDETTAAIRVLARLYG
jgi:hypothetical protein